MTTRTVSSIDVETASTASPPIPVSSLPEYLTHMETVSNQRRRKQKILIFGGLTVLFIVIAVSVAIALAISGTSRSSSVTPPPTTTSSPTVQNPASDDTSTLSVKKIKCSMTTVAGTTRKQPIISADSSTCPTDTKLLAGDSPGKWFQMPGHTSNGEANSLTCVTLSTCHENTTFDTRLRVFVKDDEKNILTLDLLEEELTTCVAGNDDDKDCAEGVHASTVKFQMTPNVWHYILVDSFDPDESGNFTLTVQCQPCVASDTGTSSISPTASSLLPQTEIPTTDPAPSPVTPPTLSPVETPTSTAPTPAPALAPAPSSVIADIAMPVPTSNVSQSMDVLSEEALLEIFSQVSTIEDLQTNGTPQNQAFLWALDDRTLFNTTSTSSTAIGRADDYNSTLLYRYILATFFYSTGGPTWKETASYLNHTLDICDWGSYEEITYCDLGNKLNLDLENNKLSGTMPMEIGHLAPLAHLDVGINNMGGTFPTTIGLLSSVLRSLDISYNEFTGPIPTEIGLLTDLKILFMRGTKFVDTIPEFFGSLTQLEALSIADMTFYNSEGEVGSSIPTEYGNMSKLVSFHAENASLTGTIPSELSSLVNLQEFHLQKNNLEGTIPNWIGSSLPNLYGIWLYENNLQGTIPPTFSQLKNIEFLYLYDNNITGDAEFLCDLPETEWFFVDAEKVNCSCCTDK